MHQEALGGGLTEFDQAIQEEVCPFLNRIGEVALGEIRNIYKQIDAGDYSAIGELAEQLASSVTEVSVTESIVADAQHQDMTLEADIELPDVVMPHGSTNETDYYEQLYFTATQSDNKLDLLSKPPTAGPNVVGVEVPLSKDVPEVVPVISIAPQIPAKKIKQSSVLAREFVAEDTGTDRSSKETSKDDTAFEVANIDTSEITPELTAIHSEVSRTEIMDTINNAHKTYPKEKAPVTSDVVEAGVSTVVSIKAVPTPIQSATDHVVMAPTIVKSEPAENTSRVSLEECVGPLILPENNIATTIAEEEPPKTLPLPAIYLIEHEPVLDDQSVELIADRLEVVARAIHEVTGFALEDQVEFIIESIPSDVTDLLLFVIQNDGQEYMKTFLASYFGDELAAKYIAVLEEKIQLSHDNKPELSIIPRSTDDDKPSQALLRVSIAISRLLRSLHAEPRLMATYRS